MDKLLKAIKQHYQQEVQVTLAKDGGYLLFQTYNLAHIVHVLFAHSCQVVATFVKVMEDDGATEENSDPACEEEIFSPAVFVNTRRGKGNGTKRKISDASIPPSAAPVRPSAQLHRDTCCIGLGFTCFSIHSNQTCESLFLREGWWWGGWVRWAQRKQKEKGILWGRFRGHPDWDRCQRGWQ